MSVGRCATCRHWDPNPSDGSWDVDYGECRHLVADRPPYPPATAWAEGPEVDEVGLATTAAFGCTEYQPTEEPK
jgi:hypothetical protein